MENQAYNQQNDAQLTIPSHFVEVEGSKIHYLEQGQGDPILFIHGMPTWSYLWRKIIPEFSSEARCIAPDFIGFGLSDKPRINYRVFDLIKYLDAFINKLNLSNITLVVHGWGSIAGFDIAMRNPQRFKALAFMEAYLKPFTSWEQLPLPIQELSSCLSLPDGGKEKVLANNDFITHFLQAGIIRKFTNEELENYLKPFPNRESRMPIWQFLQDMPIPGGPEDVKELINHYSEKLSRSAHPKLLIYGMPGFNTPIEAIKWAKDHLSKLTLVEIEEAYHFLPEGYPTKLAEILKNWFSQIKK